MEGLSGSAFADVLHGDDNDARRDRRLRRDGQRAHQYRPHRRPAGASSATGVTSFGAGNIILGGAGSDIIEGRGGNDIIDGDAWLNVQIGVYDDLAHTNLLTRHNSMTELTAAIFAGTINPGQLGIIREIRTTALDGTPIGPDFDTAKFSDVNANYDGYQRGRPLDGQPRHRRDARSPTGPIRLTEHRAAAVLRSRDRRRTASITSQTAC